MTTSFTGSEWAEFVDGVGDPDEAWDIACHIWNEEREQKLDEYREFIESRADDPDYAKGKDLLDAAYALYTGNTTIYHEVMDRLRRWVYDHGYEPIVYESDLMYRGR